MSARRLFTTESESKSESDSVAAHLVRVLAGFAAPIAAWLAVLASVGGGTGIHHYALATWEGALGAARGMSTPAPRFVWEMPVSGQSATALLFLLVPVTYLASLALHVGRFRRRSPAYSWGAAYTALMGLAIFPQALHRADAQHLLQVIPPFFLAGLVLYRRLELSHRPAAVACLVAIAVAVAPSTSEGAADLGHWYRNPLWTYGSLARVLDAETTHANAPLLRAVRRHVPPDRPILVADVVTDSQFYYFAERRTSGVVVVYAPGVLDSPSWRKLEIERILDDPPEAVIAPSSSKSEATELLASRQPEVARFVRNYTRVLYASTDWKVLVRP